ncbi:aromatic ring-opening dioxygenase catalytic subunit LigB [Acetobacter indonesiensis NRIC 0313]|uniref:Dioxygenase n=1 Tax=Acetobacter indonesiensis TaxID=104101 RepID=A0A6N3T6Q1_9PROT|nr:class III extradiol ring-cleavage dioxygenase [Acetobacter indonesiensis]GAN61838.1 aromatic ring-opening dioxygenase catalytic subunit LigB [Acetobacter indonesiensis]GBQ58047.1 aromatic ring-opening dioxygenase catalytic subunit LigB [Acetobacter indonesiensis NRIC 0313]GEN03618.1 dioxygenase [Acetobacter indonesiensis]
MPEANPIAQTKAQQPVLFLPHGGGPCFFMDWPDTWDNMAAYLRSVSHTLPQKPDAILVVSGHWETDMPTVTSGSHPSLLYDYYGFPAHTYQLRYPAVGAPHIATKVTQLLQQAGIPAKEDAQRGFDHGVFIPLMLAFENADIPVVELSLQQDLDPALHLRIGAALASLREQNILIIGTGMTYHNLRHFMTADPRSDAASRQFDAWLANAISLPAPQRNDALTHWQDAPAARICHPREEHLLPLMVVAGAAGTDTGVRTYTDTVMGKALSAFSFGV